MKNLLLITTVMIFAACGEESNKTSKQQDTTTAEPTYWESIQEYDPQKTNVVIDGKEIELIYFKMNEESVFRALELSRLDNPNKQQIIGKHDLTNDGIEDSIVCYRQMHNPSLFELGYKVYDRGKLIFTDSVIADTGYYEWRFGRWIGDSAFIKLMPYSLMQSLYLPNSIDKLYSYSFIDILLEERYESLLAFTRAYAANTSNKPEYKQRDIMIYVSAYEGPVLFGLDLYEPEQSTYIWYAPDSAFIQIFNFYNAPD